LEEKNKGLQEKLKQKKEELRRAKNISTIVKELRDALIDNGDSSNNIQEKISKLEKEKENKISSLQDQLQNKRQKIEQLKEQNEDLKKELERFKKYENIKTEIKQWKNRKEEIKEAITRLTDAVNVDISGPNEELKETIQEQQKQIKELKEKEPDVVLEKEFRDAKEFLKKEAVRKEIKKAIDKVTYKETHAWDILTALIHKEELTSKEIAAEPHISISTSSVRTILGSLKKHEVIKYTKKGGTGYYSIDKEKLKNILKRQKKEEEMEELKKKMMAKT